MADETDQKKKILAISVITINREHVVRSMNLPAVNMVNNILIYYVPRSLRRTTEIGNLRISLEFFTRTLILKVVASQMNNIRIY